MWLYRAIADIGHGHISLAAMKVEPKLCVRYKGYRLSENLKKPQSSASNVHIMAKTTDMTRRMATSLGILMLRKMAVRLSVGVRCYLNCL